MRINWRNKAENVKEIAEELNIGSMPLFLWMTTERT